LKGHDAPVRGLIESKADDGFISVGNDGYLKLFSYEGDIKKNILASISLIYDVTILSTGEIITSSEDKKIKIWRDYKLIQTIEHPNCLFFINIKGVWECRYYIY
jgi:phospholipase A-2-activating protein